VLVVTNETDLEPLIHAAFKEHFKTSFVGLTEGRLSAALSHAVAYDFLVWIFVGNPLGSIHALVNVLSSRSMNPVLVVVRLPRDDATPSSDAVLVESTLQGALLRLHAFQPHLIHLRKQESGLAETARIMTVLEGGQRYRRSGLYVKRFNTENVRSTWCGSARPSVSYRGWGESEDE
jgi:hypothetical protein